MSANGSTLDLNPPHSNVNKEHVHFNFQTQIICRYLIKQQNTLESLFTINNKHAYTSTRLETCPDYSDRALQCGIRNSSTDMHNKRNTINNVRVCSISKYNISLIDLLTPITYLYFWTNAFLILKTSIRIEMATIYHQLKTAWKI